MTSPTAVSHEVGPVPAADLGASERAATLIPTALAVLLYLGALRNGFAYDDLPVVRDNDWIHHGTALARALVLPYWPNGALYRPLTSVSYAIDWLVGGGSPILFHAVNLAWYALGTALVARVALQWWPPLAAGLAAGLFAIQPLHVEAVANVVGRAELLAAVALLALTLTARGGPAITSARLAGIAALAALALAAKETGVVAPLIAWAAARARPEARGRDTRRVTLAALVGVALVLAQRFSVLGTLAGDSPHAAFQVATGTESLELALASLPRAVLRLFIPLEPQIDYSPTGEAVSHAAPALVALGVLLLAAVAAVLVRHSRHPSRWSFAIIFSAATFAPVSNLVLHTGVVLADRTLYGPSIGACLLVGGLLAALFEAGAEREAALLQAAARVSVAALVLSGAFYTLETVPVWHDNASVFTAMRDRSPTSYRGYYLLGKERRAEGPSAEAHEDYLTAIALFDGDPGLLYDAGMNALGVGDTADAFTWLAKAVDRSPTHRRARTSLALLHLHRNEVDPARRLLQRGLALEPDQHYWRKTLDSLDRARADAAPGRPARQCTRASGAPTGARPPTHRRVDRT